MDGFYQWSSHSSRPWSSRPIDGTGCLLLGMDQDDGTCNFEDDHRNRGVLNGSMTELRCDPPTREFLPAQPAVAFNPQPTLRNPRPSTLAPPLSSLTPHFPTLKLQPYLPGSGTTRGRKWRSKRICTSASMASPPRRSSISGLSTAFTTETTLLGATTSMPHA